MSIRPGGPSKADLSNTYSAASDRLAVLANQGAADRARSGGLSRCAYEDKAAFVDLWADLTNWGSPATLQVTGGRLFTVTTGGAAGANHSYALAAGTSTIPAMAAPTGVAAAGGSLAAGTYSYVIAAASGAGEALPSPPLSIAATAGQKITLTFAGAPGAATLVKIYRGTQAGAERLIGTVLAGVTTFVDDGTVTPTASPSPLNLTGLTQPDFLRVVSTIQVVAGAGGGHTLVGLSKDTAGAAFTSGAANLLAIGVNGSQQVESWISGVSTLLDGTNTLPSGVYTVTVDVSPDTISFSLTSADRAKEYTFHVARSSFAVNNLGVYISDSRTTSGNSIGPIGARKARATIAPRTSIEGLTTSTIWSAIGSNNIRIALPASYDSRKPSPLILGFHSYGTDERMFASNTNARSIAAALNEAGYIVASTSLAYDEIGNQPGTDAVWALYRYVRDTFHIGGVGLLGISMGGLLSLNSIVEQRIPTLAWYGIVPVTNLAAVYADVTNFQAATKTAYGIASDGSDYAAKTAGRDPMLADIRLFRSLPMRFVTNSQDVLVPRVSHTDSLAARLASVATTTVVDSGGAAGHSDVANYIPNDAVAFFDRTVKAAA